MLVLSRKPGEQIVIGDGITITIQKLSGSRVSVGIDAPPHVSVLRGELTVEEEENLELVVCSN